MGDLLTNLTQRQDVVEIVIAGGRISVIDDTGDQSSALFNEDGLTAITRWLDAGVDAQEMHDGLR